MKPSLSLIAAAFVFAATAASAGPLDKTECIAGAKPGGGFDLTCKLAQSALHDGKFIADPMRVTYMPGGIGAVAYNSVVAQRPDSANTIVAFSGGSLLNLAQGKFGRYNENDVRWLAGVGTDFGAVVVAENSPYKSLKDVLAAIKADPTKVIFGAGGTVGSQDWMKAALTARSAGVSPKSMRFVAFEGGGEALTALQGGHIHVFTGDAAETSQQIKAGSKVRILAVMADKRLTGDLANIPTAKEQGADVEWPIIRGFYMGPKVSDADFAAWTSTFTKMMATPAYDKLRTERGLFSFAMTGPELDAYVKKQVAQYRTLVAEFGLVVAK
jgi:putative tricarboxylic transport membrane protein